MPINNEKVPNTKCTNRFFFCYKTKSKKEQNKKKKPFAQWIKKNLSRCTLVVDHIHKRNHQISGIFAVFPKLDIVRLLIFFMHSFVFAVLAKSLSFKTFLSLTGLRRIPDGFFFFCGHTPRAVKHLFLRTVPWGEKGVKERIFACRNLQKKNITKRNSVRRLYGLQLDSSI